MDDLISRQAVLENAFAIYTHECGLVEVVGVATIKDLPSVKPQERTGHWNLFHTTEHGMREDSYFKCNRCNYESYKEYNYCPNCGAKMSENPTGSKDVIWYSKRNYFEVVVELYERN